MPQAEAAIWNLSRSTQYSHALGHCLPQDVVRRGEGNGAIAAIRTARS